VCPMPIVRALEMQGHPHATVASRSSLQSAALVFGE
jgi:hypothetical protein